MGHVVNIADRTAAAKDAILSVIVAPVAHRAVKSFPYSWLVLLMNQQQKILVPRRRVRSQPENAQQLLGAEHFSGGSVPRPTAGVTDPLTLRQVGLAATQVFLG